MAISATILCENTVFSNIGAIAEHGWSVLLETGHGNFLFDTGQGKALLNNARYFKKDLSILNGIVLSHNHIDHTGGLLDAVQMAAKKPVTVYAHPNLFIPAYLIRGGTTKFIGVPFSRAELEAHGASFSFNTEFTELAPDIYLTGEVPRLTGFEQGDDDIVRKAAEGYMKDPVIDDQSIIIRGRQGLFIILGCSHAGIINILSHARKKTGEERIHTVIGGTHLWSVSEEQKEKTIQALKRMGIERLGVSHCTGFEISRRLIGEFGQRFFYCNVGTVVED
ncbi:MAG TPA: MBL fold metallo-hydrolase [Selenomonadales bacterium]|nr:MBL fold metallo-hydrolase [Selenomonadales bacterium]